MHIDLQRIVEDEVIKMNVPIHFIGEDVAAGVKTGGGTCSSHANGCRDSCLPKDLPEYLEVDISELELDAMLYLSDIKLPEGVEIPELAQGPNRSPIVSIHVIKEVVIEEEDEWSKALKKAKKAKLPEAMRRPRLTSPATTSIGFMISEKTANWRSFCLRCLV